MSGTMGGQYAAGSALVPVPDFDIVVFGAAGDLALRKLIPSLFHRWRDGQISKASRIIGVSRTAMDCEAFRDLALGSFREFHSSERVEEAEWGAFTKNLRYCELDAAHAEADWSGVRNALEGAGYKQRISYLALPAALYGAVSANIAAACGWSTTPRCRRRATRRIRRRYSRHVSQLG